MAGEKYDVFLSYNSQDKPAVEDLARQLRERSLRPFLDRWCLVPGEPWQEAIEEALQASNVLLRFPRTRRHQPLTQRGNTRCPRLPEDLACAGKPG